MTWVSADDCQLDCEHCQQEIVFDGRVWRDDTGYTSEICPLNPTPMRSHPFSYLHIPALTETVRAAFSKELRGIFRETA